MTAPVPLQRLEAIIDRSRVAGRIEALLPIDVRPRQLRVRTLLTGMLLTLAGHRPAHLTRVHQALTDLPEADRIRLGVVAAWKHGPHLLTCQPARRERKCDWPRPLLTRTAPRPPASQAGAHPKG